MPLVYGFPGVCGSSRAWLVEYGGWGSSGRGSVQATSNISGTNGVTSSITAVLNHILITGETGAHRGDREPLHHKISSPKLAGRAAGPFLSLIGFH